MKRISFRNGKYAGVKIKGTVPMVIDSNRDGVVGHAERAAWLTAQVESNGKYGCVMNYDGTGMTAGLHQAVAVYPKSLDSKGSLWELLRDIQLAISSADDCSGALPFMNLQAEFVDNGYEFCVDGYLRNRETGRRAKGLAIRALLTGDAKGVMPVSGERRVRAERFVGLFHELSSSPATFEAQNAFGMKHFSRWSRRKMRMSKKHSDMTIDDFVYQRAGVGSGFLLSGNDFPDDVDLAMCMFWSHTVNAPGQALKLFCKVADTINPKRVQGNEDFLPEFSRKLIRKLGTSKYGRWDDDLKNGRYQRTRRYAMMMWPKELFVGAGAIMPKDIPD